MTFRALQRLIESVKRKLVPAAIYDVESFVLGGGLWICDIGAHQDLQKPNFVMPSLSILDNLRFSLIVIDFTIF